LVKDEKEEFNLMMSIEYEENEDCVSHQKFQGSSEEEKKE